MGKKFESVIRDYLAGFAEEEKPTKKEIQRKIVAGIIDGIIIFAVIALLFNLGELLCIWLGVG